MTRRVLLLDTTFSAAPMLRWLLDQGYDVWTIGNRPEDMLARLWPGRYLREDYSDVNAVQRHIDRLNITYVVPGCTDVSIATATKLRCIKTRFDSEAAHAALSQKDRFGALCKQLGLAVPSRFAPSDLPLTGTLIAKPSDGFSGRGISTFDGQDLPAGRTAIASAQEASPRKTAVLETYVVGQLFSYSAFLEQQDVTEAFFVREACLANPFAVDLSHVVIDMPERAASALRHAVETLARALHLVDGLLHIQFIWDGTTAWLIECCRRCPGDLYARLIELTHHTPYAGRYAAAFVGASLQPQTAPTPKRHILRHTLTSRASQFDGLRMNTPLPVIEAYPLATLGQHMANPGQPERVALLFMEYPTDAALRAAMAGFT
jgi:hypothetical protein